MDAYFVVVIEDLVKVVATESVVELILTGASISTFLAALIAF